MAKDNYRYKHDFDEEYFRVVINRYRQGAANYRYHREAEWDENNQYYHMKTTVNRITQRQAICVPTTKQTINTIHSLVSSPVEVEFNSSMDNESEMIAANAFWQTTSTENHLDEKESVDTKQVELFGRTYGMWDIRNGEMQLDIISPYNVLIDRFVKSYDIQTAHYVEIGGFFQTIGQILQNDKYKQEAKDFLYNTYVAQYTSVRDKRQSGDNFAKDIKQQMIGDIDTYYPIVGQTELELSVIYMKFDQPQEIELAIKEYKLIDKQAKKVRDDGFIWFRVVKFIETYLQIEPIISYFKINEFPGSSWCSDLENDYWYSYSPADDVRTMNKVSNVLTSQMVENRARLNLNTVMYDATVDNIDPTTFDMIPGAWIPMPGKPSDIVMPFPVQGLEENINLLNYQNNLAQSVSAATAMQQGMAASGGQTLGEIQTLNNNATSRITSMGKNKIKYWEKLAKLWLEILANNQDKIDTLKTQKVGKSGKIYNKFIKPSDFAKEEYDIRVTSSSVKKAKDIEEIQKLQYLMQVAPDIAIFKKKFIEESLKLLDIDPKDKIDMIQQAMASGGLNPQAAANGQAAGQIGAGLPQGDNAGIPSATMPQAQGGQNLLGKQA